MIFNQLRGQKACEKGSLGLPVGSAAPVPRCLDEEESMAASKCQMPTKSGASSYIKVFT